MGTKKVVVNIILSALLLAYAIVAIAQTSVPNTTQDATSYPTIEESTEVVIEESTEPVEVIPAIPLYDVPLDAELQLHIIHVAEEKRIDPAIVIAMAYKESSYNPEAVGDNCNSYGLLQVQPKWHYERMQKLNCTDLLDPYQNVTVAVDYLGELLDRYGDIEKALTAYNRGSYNGTITEYAKTVTEIAKECAANVL